MANIQRNGMYQVLSSLRDKRDIPLLKMKFLLRQEIKTTKVHYEIFKIQATNWNLLHKKTA